MEALSLSLDKLKTPLSAQQLAAVGRGALQALQGLHGKGLLHNDVKPAVRSGCVPAVHVLQHESCRAHTPLINRVMQNLALRGDASLPGAAGSPAAVVLLDFGLADCWSKKDAGSYNANFFGRPSTEFDQAFTSCRCHSVPGRCRRHRQLRRRRRPPLPGAGPQGRPRGPGQLPAEAVPHQAAMVRSPALDTCSAAFSLKGLAASDDPWAAGRALPLLNLQGGVHHRRVQGRHVPGGAGPRAAGVLGAGVLGGPGDQERG